MSIINKPLSWRDAETLLREGRAVAFRDFTLRQIAQIADPELTLVENINKIFHLIRVPWTSGNISGLAISYYHPIYIVADRGNFILKMDCGLISKTKHPGQIEFTHHRYLSRISKPYSGEIIKHEYRMPYSPEGVDARIKHIKRLQEQNESSN